MSRSRLRVLAYLALASALFVSGAEAGVGANSGGAFSSFGRLSPVQTVQDGGDCWYDNAWNGPGWYQCGNEWNNGFGSVGAADPFVGPAIRRHHRHGVVVLHPWAPSPVYPGAPSRRLGAGAVPHSGLHPAAPAFGGAPGFRRFGSSGVHTPPGLHAGAQPTSPGAAGGGFRSGFGGLHQFHAAGVPHIGAQASPIFGGGSGLHGLGGVTGAHIGPPASPNFAIGSFRPNSAIGASHIGAPASPRLPGVGFRGFGGGGAFQGSGAAFGQAGAGHR